MSVENRKNGADATREPRGNRPRRTGSRKTRSRKGLAVATVLSAFLAVAACCAVLFGSGFVPLVDRPDTRGGAVARSTHMISRSEVSLWCPSRVGLPDSGKYGDSQFTASQGDLDSALSVAGVGSVFDSSLSTPDGQSAKNLGMGAFAGDQGKADRGRLAQTTLVRDAPGSGLGASVASWASNGDVRGLSAISCVAPALHSRFLVPSTRTGRSNRLLIANPSSKPTVVSVRLWGTKRAGVLSSRVASRISLSGHSQESFDLSAAAPGQQALFVSLTSSVTPVSAAVASTAMKGLNAQGVDFEGAVPTRTGVSGRASAIAGLRPGAQASVVLFSAGAASLRLSWCGKSGRRAVSGPSGSLSLPAGRVVVRQLGKVPSDSTALVLDGDGMPGVSVAVVQSVSGDRDSCDFDQVGVTNPAKASVIALPSALQARLSLANPSDVPVTVRLSALGGSGVPLGTRDVAVPAGGSVSLSADDVARNARAVVLRQPSARVVWTADVTREDLARANVPALASLSSVSLMPQASVIQALRTLAASQGRE